MNNQTTTEAWGKEFDEYWFVSKDRTKGSTNVHRYEVKAFIKVLIAKEKKALLTEVLIHFDTMVYEDNKDWEDIFIFRRKQSEYLKAKIQSLAHSQEDREGKDD